MEPYYKLTRAVADTLATMYEVLFPEEYQKLKPAFDAAQWFLQDAGPWVGRALVYKLQVELHIDDRDVGPSVSFPCGSFTGGQMNIPQFKAKFRCGVTTPPPQLVLTWIPKLLAWPHLLLLFQFNLSPRRSLGTHCRIS